MSERRDAFLTSNVPVHTVGTPLAHASKAHASSFWKKFSNIRELQRDDITVRRGSVKDIDCASLVATFADMDDKDKEFRLPYDYVILATGLRRDWPTVPRTFTKAEYVRDATDQITGIETAGGDGIVVIGGGESIHPACF